MAFRDDRERDDVLARLDAARARARVTLEVDRDEQLVLVLAAVARPAHGVVLPGMLPRFELGDLLGDMHARAGEAPDAAFGVAATLVLAPADHLDGQLAHERQPFAR